MLFIPPLFFIAFYAYICALIKPIMKKLLFVSLLLLGACSTEMQDADNRIAPVCNTCNCITVDDVQVLEIDKSKKTVTLPVSFMPMYDTSVVYRLIVYGAMNFYTKDIPSKTIDITKKVDVNMVINNTEELQLSNQLTFRLEALNKCTPIEKRVLVSTK